VGKYHGQYHFLGRLQKPFVILTDSQVNPWLKEHPNGKIIAYYKHKPNPDKEDILYEQPYREYTLVVLGAKRTRENDKVEDKLIFLGGYI